MGANPGLLETTIRWLGGVFAYATLASLMLGILRGTRRPAGRITGPRGSWLRSRWFYLISSLCFFYISYLGWKPLPWTVDGSLRAWLLAIGTILYFPGMSFVLWGRLALGKNYFVSTGLGAQLFKGHQLITSGPFAIIRHPMYSGLILAAIGSLLLYLTWTTLLFAIFSPFILVRAHREELVLSAEFGEEWKAYCKQTPAFVPRLTGWRNRRHD